MIHFTAKKISQLGFRVNFKKIFLHYEQELPEDKAIIFAVNHPTAFIDPVILGTYLKRPTYFIVRGDIFKGKFVLAILNGLKMLPIFRFRDGYSNLKNNQGTMETVYKKLSEKKWIMVLAEGETKHEKRLRPIQKGTARMALGAIEKYGKMDLLIVPVGINYTDSHELRSYIMINVGKAIDIKEFMPAYDENPRKAVKQITDRIQVEMRALTTHFEKEEDDAFMDRTLSIKRADFKHPVFPIISSDNSLWKGEFETVEQMNQFSDDEKSALKDSIEKYDQAINKDNVSDLGIGRSTSFNFINTLFLILGFIPFLIGYVLNYPPMWLAENTAKKKVKKIEFYSSVRYGVGLIGYFFYWLLLFFVALIVSLVSKQYIWIASVFALPFIGYFAVVYMDVFEKWNAARKFKSLSKERQAELKIKRSKVLAHLK